ncbi:MAG: exodeoxyribonuclease III [Clostridia bacterium]|nr:exodeoxyribonuclease III [Clostridia bacterium]
MTKLISWNVNGLRACVDKGFLDFFYTVNADIFCIQETKLQEGQIKLDLEGYCQYWNYAHKKGYSGTAVFTRIKPLQVSSGIGMDEHDHEGRVLTLEFDGYYVVNVYTPNAQRGLERLGYRMKWEDDFRSYLKALDFKKPVIVCGDLNVAHKEIDLKNPSSNRKNAGFTDEERGKFTELLDSGFIDTFRYLYPDRKDAYTWWSYMFNARQNNAGWRIDYFCVSDRLKDSIVSADIHSSILGSDHCPVELVLKQV